MFCPSRAEKAAWMDKRRGNVSPMDNRRGKVSPSDGAAREPPAGGRSSAGASRRWTEQRGNFPPTDETARKYPVKDRRRQQSHDRQAPPPYSKPQLCIIATQKGGPAERNRPETTGGAASCSNASAERLALQPAAQTCANASQHAASYPNESSDATSYPNATDNASSCADATGRHQTGQQTCPSPSAMQWMMLRAVLAARNKPAQAHPGCSKPARAHRSMQPTARTHHAAQASRAQPKAP